MEIGFTGITKEPFQFFWSVGKHDANPKHECDQIGGISVIYVNLWLL